MSLSSMAVSRAAMARHLVTTSSACCTIVPLVSQVTSCASRNVRGPTSAADPPMARFLIASCSLSGSVSSSGLVGSRISCAVDSSMRSITAVHHRPRAC